MSEYYNASGSPSTGAVGASSPIRAEFSLIAAGFALLPTLAGNGALPVFVNSGGTALVATSAATARTRLGVAIGTNVQAWDADLDAIAALGSTGIATRTAANTWAQRTITGTAAEITLTNGDGVAGNPTISLPAALTFTGKTITGGTYAGPTLTTPSLGVATATSINSLTITASTGTLTITNAKTLTASNTLTLAGNDGSTLNIGAGGTLATSATTDTTNASNINAGTLAAGRMPLGITATPSAGQILVGNAGGTAYAAVAMSSDATLSSTGAITVTKTNNVAFATSATTDTTNANNISGGTLAVARGGSGTGTLTAHGVLIGEGASAFAATAPGSAGQVLRSGGASADPAWSTATFPATAGSAANVLRSDGTNFLSVALAAADLSNGVQGSGAVVLASSPTITTAVLGSSTATTQSTGDNSTKLATTAYADRMRIVEATAQVTTSGTTFDFSSIPSGTKLIRIQFVGVSLSGNDQLLVQIGDAGGLETTGYSSVSQQGATATSSTSGFLASRTLGTAEAFHGCLTLSRENSSSNTWVASGTVATMNSPAVDVVAGSKSTSQELDRLRIMTTGVNTFDAGEVNISYNN